MAESSSLSVRKTLTRSFSDSTLFSEKEAFRFKMNREFNLKSSDYTTIRVHEKVAKGPCQPRLIKYKYPILSLSPHKNEKIISQEKSDRERQDQPKFVETNENSIKKMHQVRKTSIILTGKKSSLNVLSPLSMHSLNIANEFKASKKQNNTDDGKKQTYKFRRSNKNKENEKENKEKASRLAKKEYSHKPDLVHMQLIKYKIKECQVKLKRLDYTQLAMISKINKKSENMSKFSRVAE